MIPHGLCRNVFPSRNITLVFDTIFGALGVSSDQSSMISLDPLCYQEFLIATVKNLVDLARRCDHTGEKSHERIRGMGGALKPFRSASRPWFQTGAGRAEAERTLKHTLGLDGPDAGRDTGLEGAGGGAGRAREQEREEGGTRARGEGESCMSVRVTCNSPTLPIRARSSLPFLCTTCLVSPSLSLARAPRYIYIRF